MGQQVVRYSERPELWDALTGLSDEVWPEYNQHGATLNYYWDQLYEVFPDWQFVLYDPDDETVLAEGHTIPAAWDGTDTGLGPGIDATVTAAFDLRDLSLQPHRCETYVTKVTTVAPSTAADCPLWLRFLHRMMAGDAGMIAGLWLSANGPY